MPNFWVTRKNAKPYDGIRMENVSLPTVRRIISEGYPHKESVEVYEYLDFADKDSFRKVEFKSPL